jgi:hypothetical protein
VAVPAGLLDEYRSAYKGRYSIAAVIDGISQDVFVLGVDLQEGASRPMATAVIIRSGDIAPGITWLDSLFLSGEPVL